MPVSDYPNETNTLALLAAAEESFCQAASVLQPGIRDILDFLNVEDRPRLQTGLHLLEEAMKRHNAYMESLK